METEYEFKVGDKVPSPMAFKESNIRGTAEYKAQPGEQLSSAHPMYQELTLQARKNAESHLNALLQSSPDLDIADRYIPIVAEVDVHYEIEQRETSSDVVFAVTAVMSATGARLPEIMAMDPDTFNRWYWRLHHGHVPPLGGYPPPAPAGPVYPIGPPPAWVAGGFVAAAVVAWCIAIWELTSGGPPISSGPACGDVTTHRITRVIQNRSWGCRRSLRHAVEKAEAICATLTAACTGGCTGGKTCNSVASVQSVVQNTGFLWCTTTITYNCPCTCV